MVKPNIAAALFWTEVLFILQVCYMQTCVHTILSGCALVLFDAVRRPGVPIAREALLDLCISPWTFVFVEPFTVVLFSDGYRNKCTICFREYKHRVSLLSHMKVHQGMTTCPRCEKVCCTVKDLRKHMECVHSMTQEEVRSLVPTKPKFYSHMPYYPANQ